MITSLCWIPRGVADPQPQIVKVKPEKAPETPKAKKENINDKMEEEDEIDEDDIVKKYGLDKYDDDDDNEGGKPFWINEGLAYYDDPNDDPYITIPLEELENEDLEDIIISPTDHLFLTAVSEEHFPHLDVCILRDDEDDFYVHHDYLLSADPLSVTWLPPHLAAVGTFDPKIEIWDLNVMNILEPTMVLEGHEGAVLGLSSNPITKQILASCSIDESIKLWDIHSGKNLQTFKVHADKVQDVQWNPAEESIIASGSYDKTACIFDVRDPNSSHKIQLNADVERLLWLKSSSGNYTQLLVSNEKGFVQCYDVISGKIIWTLEAYTNAPCESLSSQYNGDGSILLSTTSHKTESPLKLWLIENDKVKHIYSSGNVGPLYYAKFAPEKPFYLIAGSNNTVPMLFDTSRFESIRHRFSGSS